MSTITTGRQKAKKPYKSRLFELLWTYLDFLKLTLGGDGGIRTLDALLAHTPLAGEHLRPLGHVSVF